MPAPKTAAKSPAKPATKSTKVVPKALKKLATHRRTAFLLSKIKARAKAKNVDPASLLRKRGKVVTKKVGGDKNGGTRRVLVGKKKRTYYPTEDMPRPKHGRATVRKHTKKVKAGLEPGRVVILLAGRHKGKRVVVLKVLDSGLLLVTGPYILNHCPLRRMHQSYTIVTSTKLDLSGFTLPDNINDRYFRRQKTVLKKKGSDDLFSKKTKKHRFTPSAQRKKDQVAIDKQILTAVNKTQDKHLMRGYLGSFFMLRNGVHPHKLKF
jgi:large subunit ribosomal protein L6e